MDQSTLKISGMTCAACAARVEKALKKTGAEARVNLATETARVWAVPPGVTADQLRGAVEAAGYGVREEDRPDDRAAGLARLLRRWTAGLAAGLLLMALMLLHPPLPVPLPWLMAVIATPVLAWIAFPVFNAAGHALRTGTLSMDVMYALGIGVSFGASLLATAGVLPSHEFLFYDTALLLASFLTLGRWLEGRARGKTSAAVRALGDLQPPEALVLRDGRPQPVPAGSVVPGDAILMRPGDRVPVDGRVTEGRGFVDESLLTGESVPVSKGPGDPLFAGTLNTNAVLTFEATGVGRDTVLAGIVRLMEEAQGSRPPLQRLADRATAWLIPAVLGMALLTFSAWLALSNAGAGFALARAVAVVVIACPCALGLATPTAVTVGIGRGAELGILIKGGEVLERAVGVATVALDKTGTLTAGRLSVTAIESAPEDQSVAEVLRLAAALERDSSHPIARAIVARAEAEGLVLPPVQGAQAIEGSGVRGSVEGRDLLLGSPEAAAPLPPEAQARVEALEAEGRTLVVLREGTTVIGLLALADRPRPEAREAVAALQARGLKVVMLTGDNPRAARAVAEETGVDEVMAGLKPAGKADAIAALQARGGRVAFAGDGINDAVALARADVGIAMGGGTDVAREGGDIVLMRDDVRGIPAALSLSDAILRRIRWNLFWAAAWNASLVPLAAGVLYPVFHLTLAPSLAALAMAFSSVTVVTLSLGLRRFKP